MAGYTAQGVRTVYLAKIGLWAFHDAVKHTVRSCRRPALVELDCQLFTMRARPFPNEFIILCSMQNSLESTPAQRVPTHLAIYDEASVYPAGRESAWLENRSCCSRRALQYPSSL
jgi:hypothetical protein